MANNKISALTSATTPLAGTETLPVVQSSTTKQVSVANLTAGRAVSATSVALNGAGSALTPAFIRNGSFSCSPFTADYQMATFGAYNDDLTNGGFVLLGLVANVVTEVARGGVNGFTLKNNLIQGTAAKGINFTANTPAAGMTSQLLNWYEEGTWTPNQGAGLTVVGGLTTTGTYTRIGRLVTVTGKYVAGTSLTIGASGVVSTNLPFTALTESVGSITTNDVTVNGSVVIGGAGTTLYNAATITAKTQMFFTVVYPI